MPDPQGFSYNRTKDGRIRISHHGRVVTTLARREAAKLDARLIGATAPEIQHLLARATGNYRHGNERA